MSDRIERFVSMAFSDWKKDNTEAGRHPDEEEIACFLEGKLGVQESEKFRGHLAACDECARLLAAELYSYPPGLIDVPAASLSAARAMVNDSGLMRPLEIILKIRDFGFEIVKASGDILFGQEFVPAAVLRGRHITDFKDEVVAVKDFPKARIEVRIQSGKNAGFHVTVSVKDKRTQRPLPDLRVTLFKDDKELESKITAKGKVSFEHVAAGRYVVTVTGQKDEIARLVIDVKK